MRYKRNPIENLEGEEWKPIVGYDGIYFVSNFGRVKSNYQKGQGGFCDENYEHLLKQKRTKAGYCEVALSFHNKQRYVLVHRLVAAAFIGDIREGLVVNHIDGHKVNNHVSNLEITTYQGNSIHAVKTGLYIPFKNPTRAIAVMKDGKIVGKYNRIVDACKELGLNNKCINNILHGKGRTHKGYTFKYL